MRNAKNNTKNNRGGAEKRRTGGEKSTSSKPYGKKTGADKKSSGSGKFTEKKGAASSRPDARKSSNKKDFSKTPRIKPESAQKPKNESRKDFKKEPKESAKSLKIDLYGMHAVKEAWLNPRRHVHTLFITEGSLQAFDETLRKGQALGLKRPAPTLIDKGLLEHSLPAGTVHQGIGLSVQGLSEIGLDDIIRAESHKDSSLLLILDQVTDPHNVGAIIRSACVFGVSGIIVQKKHAPDLHNPILAKTACGGVEHVAVAYETNLSRSIESLQEAGYFVIGLAEEGHPLNELPPTLDKIVLVLGAEGEGIRHLVGQHCNTLIALPTEGPISSLNVSNAAAVALYAMRHR